MAEQQLVDYIQKAKQANQSDDQSRALLSKNGWTDAEINDAFASITQPKVQPQQQPQYKPQPVSQPQPQYDMVQKRKSSRPISRVLISLIILLVILSAIAGAVYFVFAQKDSIVNSFNNIFSPSKTIAPVTTEPEVQTEVKTTEVPSALNLATARLATVLQDYDISRITVYTFSKTGDNVAYCVPQKNSAKIDCFLNNQKLDNSYSYKPYWIGTSPDGKRLVSLYLDPATKQSFVFENGKEGVRYDGTITAPNFSNDNQSFMYVVVGKDNKSFAVLNNNSFTPHDKIYGTPTLSSDGKYMLYGARDGHDLFWVADSIATE